MKCRWNDIRQSSARTNRATLNSLRGAPAFRAQPATKLGVLKQTPDAGGKFQRRLGRHQETATVRQRIGQAADVAGDHRNAHRQRLQHRRAKPFAA